MLKSVKIAKQQARMAERVEEAKRTWSNRTGLPEDMWTVAQQGAAYEAAAEAESDEDREQRALADIAREDAEHRAYLDETPDAWENTHGR